MCVCRACVRVRALRRVRSTETVCAVPSGPSFLLLLAVERCSAMPSSSLRSRPSRQHESRERLSPRRRCILRCARASVAVCTPNGRAAVLATAPRARRSRRPLRPSARPHLERLPLIDDMHTPNRGCCSRSSQSARAALRRAARRAEEELELELERERAVRPLHCSEAVPFAPQPCSVRPRRLQCYKEHRRERWQDERTRKGLSGCSERAGEL